MKNHFCFKKALSVLPLLLAICTLLSGCHGPQYKEDEKKTLEENGRMRMQSWLDEHLKGSSVLSAEADVFMYPSGPHYLTDYVGGSFADGSKERDYLINTKTDAVYLVHDGTLLAALCQDHMFEKLGLEGVRDDCRISSFSALIKLPDPGNSFSGKEQVNDGIWMPGGLVLSLEKAAEEAGQGTEEEEQRKLLEAFISSPEHRDALEIGGRIRVPDEIELEKCGMAYWLRQQEKNGIVFENFELSDAFESISTFSGRASYERYRFQDLEDPDIRIFMKDEYWVEKNEKDGIKVIEGKKSDFSDLTMQKTADGYLVTFTDREHIFDFSIYAEEGSEFLKHEYHSHEDREAYLSPGSKISGDRYFEYDLYWKEVGEKEYLLTEENGIRKLFFGGEELIPRAPYR